MYKRIMSSVFCLITGVQQLAAQDNLKQILSFTAYVDLFYRYDFNKPDALHQPAFLYNYNRHNETTLNLAFGKIQYTDTNYRANLAIGTGTYMNANYAAEPGLLKSVMEANAGFRLSRKKELWLDAGILPSHVGFESAIGKDCATLTRSLVAENSPYFETGIKLSYTPANNQWLLAVLALNGWQRIQIMEGNTKPSWGVQVQYKPTDNLLLNYSGFAGSDKPDSAKQFRLYHNIYAIISLGKSTTITAGLDYGQEQAVGNRKQWRNWVAPVVMVQTAIAPAWKITARAEGFRDARQVLISTPISQGFRVAGASLNLDKQMGDHLMLRLEHRILWSKYPVFYKINQPARSMQALTASLNCSF